MHRIYYNDLIWENGCSFCSVKNRTFGMIQRSTGWVKKSLLKMTKMLCGIASSPSTNRLAIANSDLSRWSGKTRSVLKESQNDDCAVSFQQWIALYVFFVELLLMMFSKLASTMNSMSRIEFLVHSAFSYVSRGLQKDCMNKKLMQVPQKRKTSKIYSKYDFDIRFCSNFCMIVCGPTCSVKSQFVYNV